MSTQEERLRAIFDAEIGTTLSADEQVLLDQMCLAYQRSIAHKTPRQWSPDRKMEASQRARKLTDKIKLAMLPGRFTDSDEEDEP